MPPSIPRSVVERLSERAALRGMVLGLEPMRDALRRLGDPHRSLRIVHVTGSNGKGSVCAMIESIARCAGLRTGFYTSPHLCRIAELVRIDGEPLDQPVLDELADAVLDACPTLTFFEVMTAVAFLAFQRARVDLVILEVGLGGAEDATNVVLSPLATAITTVALEHTRVLGESIDAIATAKAGILKQGAPVVLGPLPPEAGERIAEVARRVGAGPLWRVTRGERGAAREMDLIEVTEDGGIVRIDAPPGSPFRAQSARVGLDGPHQAVNAAVATGVVWCLAHEWPHLPSAIEAGLEAVRWPGRMERVAFGGTTVLLDCAHNLEGVGALVATLEREGIAPAATRLLFGALADKPWRQMLELLASRADRRFYTLPKGRPPASLDQLRTASPGLVFPDPKAALAAALATAGDGDIVLVTGSIYLVGEVRGHLLGLPCDPVIAY